jgi:hypothetical protein
VEGEGKKKREKNVIIIVIPGFLMRLFRKALKGTTLV